MQKKQERVQLYKQTLDEMGNNADFTSDSEEASAGRKWESATLLKGNSIMIRLN